MHQLPARSRQDSPGAHGKRQSGGSQLARLDVAKTAADMNVPGWGLHPLTGQLAGHFSITVNGNWRLTFMFEGEDAVPVDYQDYH